MNPTEQQNHKTALLQLEAETKKAIEKVIADSNEAFAAVAERNRHMEERTHVRVGNERTARLKMAGEQRAYVDAAHHENAVDICRIGDALHEHVHMGWRDRLKWLVWGK